MNKLFLILALAGLGMVCTPAPARTKKTPDTKPVLQFRADSTFKILQLTDLHLPAEGDEVEQAFARFRYLVTAECPDLIVLTGDLVTASPSGDMIRRLVDSLDVLGTPWAALYGNHDAERKLTRPEMSALYTAGKWSVNRLNEAGELADLELPVLSCGAAVGTDAPFYVYGMDSGDYQHIDGKRFYASFKPEQVRWMQESVAARTSADGSVAPSVAFFHIPLTEYIDAWSTRDNPRKGNADKDATEGIRGEDVACGPLNTGMFATMKNGGSILAVSAGHDHDSDFVALYYGIALCYGRFSGTNNTYNHLPPGGRIFLFREGSREFETWIREGDGRVMQHLRTDGQKLIRAPRRGYYGTWTTFE